LIVSPEADLRGYTAASILHDILAKVPLELGSLG
jgi:hypothetical protein